jgi:NADH-quinone oxidoreductase subunit B
MSDTGENYTTFNSRALVEVVGDVTDEALKATKIKQLLSVLAGRFFNWAGRKSLFTLHLGIKCCAIEMAASATPRFDGDRFGVLFRSSPRQSDVLLVNGPISKKFADPIVRLWNKCQSQSTVLQWENVRFLVAHTTNLTIFSKVSIR